MEGLIEIGDSWKYYLINNFCGPITFLMVIYDT